MADKELPALNTPLEDMAETELKQFIPRMVRVATGRSSAGYGKMDMRPVWWPKAIPFCNPKFDFRQRGSKNKAPWKNVLKSIIKACYEHYGHEHLLQGGDANGRLPLGSGSGAIKVVNNENGSVSFITKEAVVTLEERQNTQFAGCSDEVPFEGAVPGVSEPPADPTPAKVVKNRAAMPQQSKTDITCPSIQAEEADVAEEKEFLEIFICFFCEKEFKMKSELQKHQSECRERPDHMHYIGSPKRNGGKLARGKRSYQLSLKSDSAVCHKPDKNDFVESLGLLPRARAEKLKRQQGKGKEVDCDVIEVEDESVPKTPTTPRTPKSLISQLSREASPPPAKRRLEPEDNPVEEIKQEADTGSDCGEEDPMHARRINTLLAIDISSPLGQRVKKHIPDKDKGLIAMHRTKTEGTLYEQFCHTPEKSEFHVRLRQRDSTYPVTFRSRRKPGKFCHEYSFTKTQRVERYRVLSTGLNRRARALKRQMDKCSVKIQRLSKEKIRSWTRRRPRPTLYISPNNVNSGARWYSPQRPVQNAILLSPGELQQVLRLQRGQQAKQGPVQFLDLSQIASDDISAEIQQQRAAIYKTLLSDSLLKQSRPRSGSSADLTPPTTPENSLQQFLINPTPQFVFRNSANAALTSGTTRPVISHMFHNQNQNRQLQSRNRDGCSSNGSQKNRPVVDLDDDLDVISISSSDNEDSSYTAPQKSVKRNAVEANALQAKRRKIEEKKPPSALLFRCHLCLEEITCRQNAAQTIKFHFAEKHRVTNIDLVEHTDENGQKVVSIVEVSVPHFDPAVPSSASQSASLETAASRSSSYPTARKASSSSDVAKDGTKAGRNVYNGIQSRPTEVICID